MLTADSGVLPDGKTRVTTYVDNQGRKFLKRIPVEAPDSHAKMGLDEGPPNLKALGLPMQVEVRLNNELFDRGLFTLRHVRVRRNELFAALQAAYKADVQAIEALYEGV